MYYYKAAIVGTYTANKLFSYHANTKLPNGVVVNVPFGNKQLLAIIIENCPKPDFKTKAIISSTLYKLSAYYLKLMLWMFDYYPDDNGFIAKLFVPSKFKTPKSDRVDTPEGYGETLPKATLEQHKILKTIKNSHAKRIFIHGDTGTGKTRVFIEIARDVLDNGSSVIILTPEIGLTPQLVIELERYLKYPVILNHSEMPISERLKIWHWTYHNRKPAVFVGPRSILFLPIFKLGLIVIDESHDSSYKQLQPPKYQTLNVAGKLASLNHATLIHSTATPNIDEYETAKAHKFLILTMSQTAAGKQKGSTHIIDIKNRSLFSKNPHLSTSLINAISNALSHREQAMLYLNRRGSARLIQCAVCGWQADCPNCNLPLVYHHDQHLANCHVCSYRAKISPQCPKCYSTEILFKVIGTKALFEYVSQIFPKARISRFDADSTKDDRYFKNIENIKSGAVDIIIGTQLITKGIDLPKLSVVGIINADSSLNLPDYRAEEIAFQQLYQATGRALRGHKKSQVFIQTRLPDHPIIQAVYNRSWLDFYKYELSKRLAYSYPPYIYLATLKIYKKTMAMARNKSALLKQELSKIKGIQLLGPSPSFYEKSPRGYCWQIIIKAKKRSVLVKIAEKLPPDWIIDIDATSTL